MQHKKNQYVTYTRAGEFAYYRDSADPEEYYYSEMYNVMYFLKDDGFIAQKEFYSRTERYDAEHETKKKIL